MTIYAIHSILAVTILFAGMFAFMPVEEVTAVHTTVQNTQFNQVISTFETDLAAGSATCTSDSDFVVYLLTSSVANTADDDIDLAIGGDTLVFEVAGEGATAHGSHTLTVAGEADDTITIDGATDNGIDSFVTLITQSGATAECL